MGMPVTILVADDGTAASAAVDAAFEDFSFPRGYVDAAKAAFGLIRGVDTVTGNEDAQRDRVNRDFNPAGLRHDSNGALNHSMLYLIMGHDNARTTHQLYLTSSRIGWMRSPTPSTHNGPQLWRSKRRDKEPPPPRRQGDLLDPGIPFPAPRRRGPPSP